jgi:hypothetical protein
MSKESIKEYGDDLLNQHKELEKKQKTLRNKVVKRFKFLLKNSNNPYLEGFNAEGHYNIETMIFVIKRVEGDYVAQSVQTNLFDKHEDGE